MILSRGRCDTSQQRGLTAQGCRHEASEVALHAAAMITNSRAADAFAAIARRKPPASHALFLLLFFATADSRMYCFFWFHALHDFYQND